MGYRSFVSFAMFLLPVAVTLGILLGVDLPRQYQGKQSIFAPPKNNKITTDTFCQLSYGFTPDPGRFTFNPNQWGVAALTPDAPGNLCMNVTFYENGTYPTNATSPSFTATWGYTQGSQAQPVHAFPNAMIEIPDITGSSTVQLSSLSSMPVDVAWTYGTGDTVAAGADSATLVAAELNANICFDMFLDSDPTKAVTTNTSSYEVMIWFGQYGLSTQPIGNLDGIKATKTINTTAFNLYDGENSNTGQKVFTWVAASNTTDFEGDVGELLSELANYNGPSSTDHLGYIAFGSEALYSGSNVTFAVSALSVDLVTG